MASGWANDGAVRDQIDSTVNDASPAPAAKLQKGGEKQIL